MDLNHCEVTSPPILIRNEQDTNAENMKTPKRKFKLRVKVKRLKLFEVKRIEKEPLGRSDPV